MYGEGRFLTTLTARDVTDPGPVPIRLVDSGLLMGGTLLESARGTGPGAQSASVAPQGAGASACMGIVVGSLEMLSINEAYAKIPVPETT